MVAVVVLVVEEVFGWDTLVVEEEIVGEGEEGTVGGVRGLCYTPCIISVQENYTSEVLKDSCT
jgi:hypothetical protein